MFDSLGLCCTLLQSHQPRMSLAKPLFNNTGGLTSPFSTIQACIVGIVLQDNSQAPLQHILGWKSAGGWWWHIKKDFKSSLANVGFGESMICPRASDGCLQSWRRRSLPRAPTCFSFGSDLKTCLHITRNMATQLLSLGFRQAVVSLHISVVQ